ncbi:hypothetical protein [Viridibacillus arvi]|uniref:hypothetical protein n=1 Tax=Viridibacillus arvi TaxID=263475 RepID=UPI0034CE22AD
MNVRDKQIIEFATEGKSASYIVKHLRENGTPIADKTVRKVLINNGYTYNESKHTWVQSEPNKELIETNSNRVEPVVEVIQEKDLIKTNRTPNRKTNTISFWDEVGLSSQEFAVMKEIIRERMEHAATTADQNDTKYIYEEISKLKARNRKNKTYYISEDLIEDVGEFADKLNVKLSQLVELSLIEFMRKYKNY